MFRAYRGTGNHGAYIYDLTLNKDVCHQRMKLSDLHPSRQIEFRNHLFGSNTKYHKIAPWNETTVEFDDIYDDLWNNIFCKYLQCIDIALGIRHCCKYFYDLTHYNQSFNNYWKAQSISLIHFINSDKLVTKSNDYHILHDSSEYDKEFYHMKLPINYQSNHWFRIHCELNQFIKKYNQLSQIYKKYEDLVVLYDYRNTLQQALVSEDNDYIMHQTLPLLYQMIRFDCAFLYQMLLPQLDKLNVKYDKLNHSIYDDITPLYIGIRYNSQQIVQYLLNNCSCHGQQ